MKRLAVVKQNFETRKPAQILDKSFFINIASYNQLCHSNSFIAEPTVHHLP
jgi:hypothetical protein